MRHYLHGTTIGELCKRDGDDGGIVLVADTTTELDYSIFVDVDAVVPIAPSSNSDVIALLEGATPLQLTAAPHRN